MRKKLISLFISLGCLMVTLTACEKPVQYVTWKEEVKLNDGRTIVVSQKKFCDGGPHTGGKFAYCLDREAWLTIDLPEFNAQPIVWHEHLHPMIVNIDNGKLYVVGTGATQVEFRLYGDPQSPYIGFVWEGGQWKKLSFNEIPESIYDTNMLIEGIPPKDTLLLTLKEKNSEKMNGKVEYHATKFELRIDPNHKRYVTPMYQPKSSQ